MGSKFRGEFGCKLSGEFGCNSSHLCKDTMNSREDRRTEQITIELPQNLSRVLPLGFDF